MISVLETYDIDFEKRIVLKEFDGHIEAPNWTPDGKKLLYNSAGKIYSFDLKTGASLTVYTGKCNACNNDHVLSPDGQYLAISAGTNRLPLSRIWVLPIAGGEPRLITKKYPSYLHGWSPDGETLAYCAKRKNGYDVYTISMQGGPETRLTDAPGLNDGPEYAPDGKTIWFNSVRTGLMQLWKMDANGGSQTQVTFSRDRNSWFPHVSPDNRRVVYIAYRAGDVKPGSHPPNKDVEIRMLDLESGATETLLGLFGGQGTMNVNSWAPDSSRFAFVSYHVGRRLSRHGGNLLSELAF